MVSHLLEDESPYRVVYLLPPYCLTPGRTQPPNPELGVVDGGSVYSARRAPCVVVTDTSPV